MGNSLNYQLKRTSEQIEYSAYSSLLVLLLLSRFSRVQLCATPQMAAHQALPSLGFSRQEHWSGLPFPSPQCKVRGHPSPQCGLEAQRLRLPAKARMGQTGRESRERCGDPDTPCTFPSLQPGKLQPRHIPSYRLKHSFRFDYLQPEMSQTAINPHCIIYYVSAFIKLTYEMRRECQIFKEVIKCSGQNVHIFPFKSLMFLWSS